MGDSSTKIATTAFVAASIPPLAQCRLVYSSSAQIVLEPCNGNQINLDGTSYTIPSSGITLANTGLTAATLYYVYAYDNAGTLALQASTTGHSVNTTTGLPQMTGTAATVLVGWVYMGPGTPGTFVDTAASRTVVSYFNRRNRELIGANTASGITNTSYAEVTSAARVQFISTGDDAVTLGLAGYIGGATNQNSYVGIGIDGATTNPFPAEFIYFSVTSASIAPVGGSVSTTLAEQWHYATVIGKVQTSGTTSMECCLCGFIRG